jgi:hypothetical protein
VLASLLLAVGTASADPDPVGNDEVTLKDGGSVRGTVVSSEPGVSVKILELGERVARVIPWDQVNGVERGKFAPVPTTVPPASPGPGFASPPLQQGPALGAPGVVRLHVESPVPVQIYSHVLSYGLNGTASGVGNGNGIGVGEGNTLMVGDNPMLDTPTQVCTSPCDRVIDGSHGQEFSAAGPNATESPWFNLAGSTGDMQLDVSPGSPGLRTGGLWLLSGGGASIGLGTALAVLGAVGSDKVSSGAFVHQSNGGLETAGFVTLGAGVAVVVGAIVMVATSRTEIHLHPAGVSSASSKPAEAKARYWAGEF